jgi:hypothetical protein
MVIGSSAKWCFRIAAVLCLVAMLGHEFLGSKKVLDPLHQIDLPADVVWLHHFSWHVGSITLIAMAVMFALGGRKAEYLILAAIGTAISAAFAVLGVSLALFGDVALWRTPAPYPWTLIAALGGVGLYIARNGTRP